MELKRVLKESGISLFKEGKNQGLLEPSKALVLD
jgi:hypothetical protein